MATELITTSNSDDGSLSIVIPKAQVHDFIEKLVKSRRIISKNFDYNFVCGKNEINDICSSILYRIKEQNNVSNHSSEVSVYYDDGSRRTYPDLKSFLVFEDTFNMIANQVSIDFIFFMSFPEFSGDAPAPEKQNVKLSFRTKSQSFDDESYSPGITIDISTNRFTWADDIINVASNKINTIFTKIKLYQRIFDSKYIYMYVIMTVSLITSSAFSILIRNKTISHETIEQLLKLKSTSISDIDTKINAILGTYRPRETSHFEIIAIVFLIFVITSIFAGRIYLRPIRVLTVNDYSMNEFKRTERRRKIFFYPFLIGTASSLVVAIAFSASKILSYI
ncbi:MAG: hypothetical protein KUA43_15455 [Hoeflea sp.]|uniref:hypothetical protein n=1 Tax=Hoeflea sp. TaxID=1940281 RepID=UPI001E060F86|nr:hypothetical protein [Hoeflea sp.]MBU4531559.1 hypothetical protein [Alphaproteobacteria bacterium]MBU4544416.1 hypothetical protein [Alphaproteobacteria bacterium]MBU4550347.1 hypothetical protein [Alphaproteobacteria bacterium]MBV1724835.1 hypothetical protein [Hoeflea sp.]MBV1760855.1 hypothetical protein [Hoeflea sp.]